MADTTPAASSEVPEPAAAPSAPAQNPYAAQPYAAAPPTNVLAIISLVLSIIGISIAGAITGHVALRQIKERGEGGYGIALAGVIVGWIGCAFWIVGWLFFLIWVLVLGGSIFAMSTMPYSY